MKKISTLFEGFTRDGNKLSYDPSNKNKLYINDDLGKRGFAFREMTLPVSRKIVYSVYDKEGGKTEEGISKNDVLLALKKKGDFVLSDGDIDVMLNRAAVMTYKNLEKFKIDTFISVQSSSDFSKKFLDFVISKFSYKPKIYYNAIKKNLDSSTFTIDDSKISQETAKVLKKDIERAMTPNGLEIKKIFVNFRKFIGNLIFIDKIVKDRDITGKNVCIVDDYVTTGTTLDCAMMELLKLEPNSLIGLTLLK